MNQQDFESALSEYYNFLGSTDPRSDNFEEDEPEEPIEEDRIRDEDW